MQVAQIVRVDKQPVAAAILGAVHGGVGVLDEQAGRVTMLRIKRYADARGQVQQLVADLERLLHGREQPLHDPAERLFIVAAREHQHEFVAAHARGHVRVADLRDQALPASRSN